MFAINFNKDWQKLEVVWDRRVGQAMLVRINQMYGSWEPLMMVEQTLGM